MRQLPLAEHPGPGTLIVLCGMDGSGKSTLIRAIADMFDGQGREVVETRQPTAEARKSELFSRYLYHPESRAEIDYRALVCHLTGDRLQHVHEVIRPALARGAVVICDRYVFTASAQLRARGFMEETWFVEICRHFPQPDLTILADPGFDLSQQRVSSRRGFRESYIETEHDRRLHREYRELAGPNGLVVLDTSGDPQLAGARASELARQVIRS